MSEKTATKIKRTVSIELVLSPPNYIGNDDNEELQGSESWWRQSEKELHRWAKRVENFLLEHRNDVAVGIKPIIEDRCSACGNLWKTIEDDNGVERCTYCGIPVENPKNPAVEKMMEQLNSPGSGLLGLKE